MPVWSSTEYTQVIEPVEAVFQSRKKDGGLVQRTLYTGKLRTTIDGGGLAPAGLDDINTGTSTTIHCIEFGPEPVAPVDSFLRDLAAENHGEYRYVDVQGLGRAPANETADSDETEPR